MMTIQEKPATVYFDNFFTSLELIQQLRNRYGIFSLGTVRSCQEMLLSDKALAKKGRGASHQIVCNEKKLAVVKWYDNKVVTLELFQKNRIRQTESKENEVSVKIKTPVAPRPPDSVRYDNIGHLPTFVPQGRCKYCKKGYTSVYCNKCNLRLCILGLWIMGRFFDKRPIILHTYFNNK
ncbi:hypothetical protein HW555_011003 [Spodoptera exigua]|uniref:PiggyBac transposable element-derived protein domain-containing protein n=1 Tax=Spodoptera exigua TaxID=7107 RepID=A0A835G8N6_SPOEX|nr:hypothetical protein HW555_011003 [Spodoptera exigua]